MSNMPQTELEKSQEELDLMKYRQSELGRTNLAGRMSFCKDCLFNYNNMCELNYETVKSLCICARNKRRLDSEKKSRRNQKQRN